VGIGLTESFVITAGDMRLLPKILDAANRYEEQPSDAEMDALVAEFDIQSILS